MTLFSLTAGEIVEIKRARLRVGDILIRINHSANYGSFGCVRSGIPGQNETATATVISASGTGISGTKDANSLNMYFLAGKLYLQNGTAGTLSNIAVEFVPIVAKSNL